jgi:hypothetical protein
MPMVEGVQLYCFAQAAAATLKLLRSAHSKTLPRKKTITQTGQLIGRAVTFAFMAFSLDRLSAACRAVAAILILRAAAVKPFRG